MLRKQIVLLFCVFVIYHVTAQHQNKYWYFGSGTDGIVFDNNNNPVKVSNKYSGVGFEGMVVVSDPWTGGLLFYTDGIKVIDKYHNLMSNGTGMLANYSGSQCVQACKVPGECKKYYVISNSSWDDTPGSFYYSIVDFTSNALGQVTTKNQLIGGPNYHQAMRIIPKTNSNNYWLIGHIYKTAIYHVYEVTPTGFTGPVIYYFKNSGRSWAMEYNVPTKKLVNMGQDSLLVTLFDFDPATGVLSNEKQLAKSPITGGWVGNFSPDGSKIYAGVTPCNCLYQYDFNTGNWTNMNTCCWAHDVKTGPNGITYFINTYSATNPLSQMTNANLSAVGNACGYSTITNPGNFNGQVRRFPEFLEIPDPPNANLDTLTVISGGSVTISPLLNDNDPQNDPFALDSITVKPVLGAASIVGNQIFYVANSGICSGTDTMTYLISDDNCMFDTANIIIHIKGGALAFSAGPDTVICLNDSAQLILSGVPTGSSISWLPSAGLSCINCSTPKVSPSVTTIYIVSVADTNGCSGSDSITINVIAPGNVSVYPLDTGICEGSTVQLNAIGGTTYSWTPTTGLDNPNSSNPIAFPSASTTYTVTISSPPCGSVNAIVEIAVYPTPPTPNILDVGDSLFATIYPSYKLYQWYYNDTLITGATKSSYPKVGTGNYNIAVTDTNGCQISVGIILDVPNYGGGKVFSVYPNPAGDFIIIQPDAESEIYNLSIYNDLGQKVKGEESPVHGHQIRLDVANLPSGIYFVKLLAKDEIRRLKFTKE